MAVKYCICAICHQKFDRNKIQAVVHGPRRYSHATCEPDNQNFVPMEVEEPKPKPPTKKEIKEQEPTKKETELAQLKDYINSLYGKKANWPIIMKQIKEYQKLGYTLSGIEKSLRYFYEVQKNNPEQSNGGIGIVAYCYAPAYQYYLDIYLSNQNNENKKINTEEKIYIIKPPKSRGLIKKLFSFGEEEG